MNELYKRSLIKLELPAILSLLAEQAVSEGAKARCLALMPSADPDEIRDRQARTSAASHLMSLKGSPGFSGVRDFSEALSAAERGGSLSAKELLGLCSALRCARRVREYAGKDPIPTVLDGEFSAITPNQYLEERISTAILSEEEIADAASSALADIRRHIRVQSARIREVLQKIVASPHYAKFLQETIITIRSDRFVVPVKSECKNEIPGLVHDVSASGGTFFIEPVQAVNANNELRELMIAERKEIERILADLSAEAAAHRDQINCNYEILLTLDCIFAQARLAYEMRACEPEIRTDGITDLKRARHPLIDPSSVVPISVHLGRDFDTLIITGPNTGGKTVTLKTLGLLTLMAECGLHIPADSGSAVSAYERVLADIGDEQSIEQSLSTFSAHMRSIVEIVSVCDRDSLVLFDELGAGTDPTEGAALAVALIQFCRSCGSRVAATTHYAELKLFAMRTEGVTNASCEFDVETLRPTFRLLIGVPGKSNAFAISKRLGLPEEIIERARAQVSESDVRFDEAIQKLEQQRQQMESATEEADRLRLETLRQKEKSDEYYEEIKKERDRAVENAMRDARQILDEARGVANQVYEELKQMRRQMRDTTNAQEFNERQAELRRSLNEAYDQLTPQKEETARKAPSREVRVGDTVELLKYGSTATVLAITRDGRYELQAGAMKMTVAKDEVYLLENIKPKKRTKSAGVTRSLKVEAAPLELDIRGMAVDEAIPILEIFLDNAMRGGLTSVRIIHGKGTGVLRAAVQDHLRRDKSIKRFRLGVYGEGENGVTIAEFS